MCKYELAFEAEPFEAYVQPTIGPTGFDTELAEREWQMEAGRNAPADIRWVQSPLNRFRGLNSPVSGVMSTPMRSAVPWFQGQQ